MKSNDARELRALIETPIQGEAGVLEQVAMSIQPEPEARSAERRSRLPTSVDEAPVDRRQAAGRTSRPYGWWAGAAAAACLLVALVSYRAGVADQPSQEPGSIEYASPTLDDPPATTSPTTEPPGLDETLQTMSTVEAGATGDSLTLIQPDGSMLTVPMTCPQAPMPRDGALCVPVGADPWLVLGPESLEGLSAEAQQALIQERGSLLNQYWAERKFPTASDASGVPVAWATLEELASAN